MLMSLSANEIRVGNYVRLNNQTTSEVKLESIHLVDCDYMYSFKGISAPEKSFDGIYLNESWLFLCGFMQLTDSDFVIPLLPQAVFRLTKNNTDVIVNDVKIKTIYYLHELQNIVFILSGRELNIEK
jgi:hypothetical protein